MIHYIKKNKYKNIFIILLISGVSLMHVLIATQQGALLNAVISGNNFEFIRSNIILISSWGLLFALNYYQSVTEMDAVQKMCNEIRSDIIDGLLNKSYEEFNHKASNRYLSLLNSDIDLIDKDGFKVFFLIIGSIISSTFSLITIFQYHSLLGIISIFMMVIIFLSGRIFKRENDTVSKSIIKTNESFFARAEELLNGFNTLYLFRNTNLIKSEIMSEAEYLRKRRVKQQKLRSKMYTLVNSINIFCQLALIALTGYLSLINELLPGTVLAIGSLSASLFNSVSLVGNYYMQLDSTTPIFEKIELVKNNKQLTKNEKQLMKKEPFSEKNIIEIRNLNYQYNEKKILENFSQTFESGQIYYLIGSNGIGKSTLLRLINGLYQDYTGEITINGIDLKTISQEVILENIIQMEQIPFLFNDTILKNVTLENREYEELILEEKIFGFDKLLKSLNNDPFYKVGYKGQNLSGGQKQWVALSRVLARTPKVLLLDEPFSNLDKKTANYILNYLFEKKNLITIIITHDLSFIRDDGVVLNADNLFRK